MANDRKCSCGGELVQTECPDCNADDGTDCSTCHNTGTIYACSKCEQDVITGNPYFYWNEGKL